MPIATKHLHNRVALVFDFDATLAPSSIDALLAHCGRDPEEFRRTRVQPLVDEGWEQILAACYALVRESRSRDDLAITREVLEEVGRGLEPFPGVPEMFGRVREWARAVVSDIDVEFYGITAGWVDMHRNTRVAHEFEEIWGSQFHFDERGEIDFPRQILTFAEKPRYLLQLTKGLSTGGPNSPADVRRKIPEGELYVPLDQMVYVGDGGSDMPAFSLLASEGALSLGVFKSGSPAEWASMSKEHPGRRLENLARADYAEGSELMKSLRLAVESVCKRVALRKLSVGE